MCLLCVIVTCMLWPRKIERYEDQDYERVKANAEIFNQIAFNKGGYFSGDSGIPIQYEYPQEAGWFIATSVIPPFVFIPGMP